MNIKCIEIKPYIKQDIKYNEYISQNLIIEKYKQLIKEIKLSSYITQILKIEDSSTDE